MGARYSSSKMNADRCPGGPVAETQHSQCRGPGFDPMVRELRPGTTKEINLELKKKKQELRELWSLIVRDSDSFKPDPENQGRSDSCPHL